MGTKTQQSTKIVKPIVAEEITPAKFLPYGQLILPSHDGKIFGQDDAQLVLDKGIPRFYIMRLQHRGRKFQKITRHSLCTQCLGSLAGKDWYIAVCPPSQEPQPDLNHLKAFHIQGDCFIKLNQGTWHAGPYFDHDFVDFYNLELADTNINDHFSYSFLANQGVEWLIVDS